MVTKTSMHRVKVSSLYNLPWRPTGGNEAQLYSFLTLMLNGGGLLKSCLATLLPVMTRYCLYRAGLVNLWHVPKMAHGKTSLARNIHCCPNFFYILAQPASLSCEEHVYTHTWLPGDCIWITTATK